MARSWPTLDEVLELPVEDLGLRVLARLDLGRWEQRAQWPNRGGQIAQWVVEWARDVGRGGGQNQTEILNGHRRHVEALAEAWEWLRVEGLVAKAVIPGGQSTDAFFVTRRGRDALAADDPLSLLRASRRLGVELHSELADPRALVSAGAFEEAAFTALRRVEERVAELAGHPSGDRGPVRGVALMQLAFRDDGPLADVDADPGERRGVRDLFAGALGAVRNPLGHRSLQWGDPTEAAEMVLLADLLMRQLDRVQERLRSRGVAVGLDGATRHPH